VSRPNGRRQAFHLAVAARREMLRSVQDRPYRYDPLVKQLAPRPADPS
jgi:hypothetical protein